MVHVGGGRWGDDARWTQRCGKGRAVRRRPEPVDHGPPGRSTRIVLATAQLDHGSCNGSPENLAMLCQRCHVPCDKHEHLRRRRPTCLARRALGDLFTGPYPTA